MLKKSIKFNAVLNVIKSLLSALFPLITYPYATRILGVSNIGKVNYGSSIVIYFSLIAVFGITSYAIREGSKVRNDKKKFNDLANELFSINLITTILSYVLLALLIVIVNKFKNYRMLILLQSLTILFTTFGVDWINTIYEDYFYITIRSILIQIISLVFLFVFVRNSDDYYIYAMLTVISNAIVCMLNYFYCKKYVKLMIIKPKHFFYHIKKMFVFFINAVAVSIYVNADTTMLGWMIGDYSVGIYSVAVKIYSIVKLILAAIYSVALPKLSYYYGKQDFFEYKKLFTSIISILLLILLPAATGIILLSKNIIILIGGTSYLEGYTVLIILGIALIFAIMGGTITQCLNISINKEKNNATATIFSALVNIILNIPFIYYLKQDGAAITTLISEFIVFAFCSYKARNELKCLLDKNILENFIHSTVGIIIVIGTTNLFMHFNLGPLMCILYSILLSVCLYFIALLILKNKFLKDILNKKIK